MLDKTKGPVKGKKGLKYLFEGLMKNEYKQFSFSVSPSDRQMFFIASLINTATPNACKNRF